MQRSFNQQDVNLAAQTVIYLGLIPFEWTQENLKAVVCPIGTVLDIHFSLDHYGKNKGFAFIEYLTPQDAQNAISVLSQTQVKNPATGYTRRFKADLSKEPNKNAHILNRPPLLPSTAAMPSGVMYPLEFTPKAPGSALGSSQVPPSGTHNGRPQEFGQPVQQTPDSMKELIVLPPPILSTKTSIPGKYVKAVEALPIPVKLPFTTPDKISETLALLSPAELIQLIANLKVIVSSGDMNRAADVFKLSPQLATAAAQALLLMGFIDEAVIQETMKSGGALPQDAYSRPYNQMQNSPLPPPPPQGPGRWPHLPISAQMKLANLTPNEAQVIAEVLAMPMEQISALAPDRQQVIMTLRQQYM
ncbi:hypothetical protein METBISCDRAFT_14880 [Metschnikowia bicuspidata]|uniref:RRM domain-containing protein n=1 Tax=Metschnikowia bicuspidata TaxID=27322 RepID=A0A4P9ZFR5_9ASCO|nr:hypothetical protein METBISCDRAFT_14880 [Metschnikowia bicuspidata]